jgi:tetratricopeptide (TPR) repeat protein
MKIASLGISAGIALMCTAAALAQTAEQHLKKCDKSYGKEKYADAVKHCTSAIKMKPGYDEALMARAAAYEKLGDNEAAFNDYTTLLEVTNRMAMFLYYRAGILVKLNEPEDALDDLDEYLERDPNGRFAARAYYMRGRIKEGLGWISQDDYRMALKLDPRMAAAKEKVKPEPATEPIVQAQRVIIKVPEPTPAGTPTLKPPAVTTPAAKPSPSPVQVAKTSPAVITPVLSKPGTLPYEPKVENKDAEPLFKEGLAQLRANKPDLAVTTLLAALGKYSSSPDPTVSLMLLADKANVYEQIAAAQLAGGHTDDALDTYKSSLQNLFMALSDANSSLARKRPKSYGEYADLAKPMIDADIVMLSMLHPSAVKIDALGRRYIDSIQAAKLTNEQLMKSLQVGILKAASGEMSSMIFQTSANLRLAAANLCKTTIANKCGPGSGKDQVSEYAAKALADMDQAIAIMPALKENYSVRAKVYRFMGRSDLAGADEAKAK